MPKTFKAKISADEIADKASRGEDISAYFTAAFTVVRPVRRVNVDLTRDASRARQMRGAVEPALAEDFGKPKRKGTVGPIQTRQS